MPAHCDLETRGPWYPLPGMPLTKFEAVFAESGFWSRDEGIFAIVDRSERMVGIVGWEQLNGDLPDVEISYRLLDRADHGKGITTEAVGLLAGWLFDTGHANRRRANVGTSTRTKASRRVVEKSGVHPGSDRSRPVGTTADSGMTQQVYTITRC